jgi:HPt (histidine-containing phosphotransfer) domain-containing protein
MEITEYYDTMNTMKERFSFLEDPNSVLERLGGNETMLTRLLVKFRETYRNTPERLKGLLASGEREEAWRLVHSIKGVSANLGIGSLYRDAIALEGRMKNGDFLSMQREMEGFCDGLETVMRELDRSQSGTRVS